MQALRREFLAQCPVDDGFRLRDVNMTRIEVFIDAAFAFAVIGVISIVFALTFPPNLMPFSGFGYALLGIWIPAAINYRARTEPVGHLLES